MVDLNTIMDLKWDECYFIQEVFLHDANSPESVVVTTLAYAPKKEQRHICQRINMLLGEEVEV